MYDCMFNCSADTTSQERRAGISPRQTRLLHTRTQRTDYGVAHSTQCIFLINHDRLANDYREQTLSIA